MGFDQKQTGNVQPVFDDDSLTVMNRQRSFAAYFVFTVIAAAVIWLGLSWYRSSHLDELDKQMLSQAAVIQRAVARYHTDNAEYPSSLDYVVQYFPKDKEWPVEPYNQLDISDTGSPEFSDPQSIGMVHYEKLEQGGKTGFRIYVFGREGVLKVLWGGYVMEP